MEVSDKNGMWWYSFGFFDANIFDLKSNAGVVLAHCFGGSFGLSKCTAFYWLLFIMRLGGKKLGPLMIRESDLCTKFSQHSQMILWVSLISEITGWRGPVSMLVLITQYK